MKLTHINYAFSNAAPDANGQVKCQLFDEWADYQKPWSAAESVDGQAVSWPNRMLGNFQQLKALKALWRLVFSIPLAPLCGEWVGERGQRLSQNLKPGSVGRASRTSGSVQSSPSRSAATT